MRLGVSAVQHDMKREETVEEVEKNTEWQRRTPKGEAGGSIPFWRAKNPGNRLISGIFIDDAKYNTHKKAPDVELQEAAARQEP